jgi:cytosine/adenosine deaminase-related metal-dependent hydrolase
VLRRREQTGAMPDAIEMLRGGHRLASAIFGERFGTMTKGAPADVVVLAYDAPTALDERTLGAHLVFGMSGLHVRDVFVGGRAVMRNRKLIGIDERNVFARAREAAAKVWSRMEPS